MQEEGSKMNIRGGRPEPLPGPGNVVIFLGIGIAVVVGRAPL